MKKIFALFLCLILILSFSVCSFGATPTSGVSVQNWPAYFTGQWDLSIAHDVEAIMNDMQSYLPIISLMSEQSKELAYQYYPIFSNTLVNISTKLNALNTFIQQDFFDLVDIRTGDIISAIGGTTAAVNNVGSAVASFNQDFAYATDININNSLGYSLYMLQQVLADEDALAFKQKNKANEQAVINFAETGTTNGNINYFSSLTSSIGSFDFLSSMFTIDYGVAESFEYIQDSMLSTDAWKWFSQSNKNDINGSASSTFSARGGSNNSDDVEIVTDYLGENKRKLTEFLEGHGR